MVQLKLEPLSDIVRSLTYTLQNEAGGRTGIFFQFYVFLWVMLTTFFIVTRILSVTSRPDPIYLASAPMYIIILYLPIYAFWIYEKKIGIERVNNPTDKKIENIWMRTVFPATVLCSKPVLCLGSLEPGSSICANISFVPLVAGNLSMGYYDLYFEVDGHKHQKPPYFYENIKINHSYLPLNVDIGNKFRFGHDSKITFNLINKSNIELGELHVKCSFPEHINYDSAFSETKNLSPGSVFNTEYRITPAKGGEVDFGKYEVFFKIGGNNCKVEPVSFGKYYIQTPEVNVRIKIPESLYSEVGNSIGIYVDNKSDDILHNVCFNSCFSSFIECHDPNACIGEIQAHSSGFTSLVVKPINPGKIDFGNLNFSFEVNEIICRQEPFDLGVHKVV
ncbi:MAG: hypothetical protein PWQ50_844 [Methanolobus sp.]|nr:hypothetical protein [Methanolobus sp.]